MYKSLAALGVAAALMFAVPQSASALPGQTSGIKNSEATNVVKVHRRGWRHRHWRHRHWGYRRGYGHRHYYRRRGPHIGIFF
jgi:hypothetical protein